ncbi:MAG TPA: hypothetical protein VFJ16_09190 [Longimicrobium sp.]|nr:hypothetical protein [Longimicrobium sp.]
MSVLPAFAVLLGFLLLIGMIDSLHAGFAGTFAALGGPAPRADMPPVCMALTAAPPGGYRWFPNSVSLTPGVVTHGEHGTWYRAVASRNRTLLWRPAGLDSVDIVGHHTPVVRLLARGAHRVGRAGWPGYVHIWDALTSPDWRMDADEIPCAP